MLWSKYNGLFEKCSGLCDWLTLCILEEVSEYGQEMPQSHTADQPMAPGGRDTEH